jgi:phage/plasmid-like protein (TIGR03299 family)
MTTATVTPLVSGTTDAHGTTSTVTNGGLLRDEARRIPAFIALSRLGDGRYAENVAGMTVPQALEAAGLDFTVAKHDGLSVNGFNDGCDRVAGLTKMRGAVAHFTDHRPPTLLGVVGEGYEVVQPAEAAQFGQAVLDEGGATVVAVGAYGDPIGSRMYMALKMPGGITIGGEDPHDLYLTIGNSWNRSTGLWAVCAPIRLDCTNQFAATFGKLSARISLRHTAGVAAEVAEVRRMLTIANTFTDHFTAFAESLLTEPMVGSDVDTFVEKLMPTPHAVKTDRGEQNWAGRRNTISYLIRAGERNTVGRGTRYAAYQGVAEWADWIKDAKSPLTRAVRAIDGGEHEQIKIRAAELLSAGL